MSDNNEFQSILKTLLASHVSNVEKAKTQGHEAAMKSTEDQMKCQAQQIVLKDQQINLKEQQILQLQTLLKETEEKCLQLAKRYTGASEKADEYRKRLRLKGVVPHAVDSVLLQAKDTCINRLIEENSSLAFKLSKQRVDSGVLQMKPENTDTSSKITVIDISSSLESAVDENLCEKPVNGSESFTDQNNGRPIIPIPKRAPLTNETVANLKNTRLPITPDSLKKVQPILANTTTTTNIRKRPEHPNYAFEEVVRKKSTRQLMHGDSCPCCSDYYRLTENLGIRTPAEASKEVLQKNPSSSASRMQESSRHRAWCKRPDTPPGFWDVGFPDSSQETA
jgi:hypothetical protein